ncbi:hypothetical protein AV929_18610 [Haloarcula sp. K1]|nr:hypothetical protein AV929_18610 [Haloarcula sp. K1]
MAKIMTKEFNPWQQRLHETGDVDDPLEEYLTQINQIVYGDGTRKQALHALLRLAFNSDLDHLTKKAIAEEAGLTTSDIYNKSVMKVFSDFGLVYPIEKVNRDKGAYIIPDQTICRPLFETEPYGLMRTDVQDYQQARRLMHWFGSRLAEGGTAPIESSAISRPIEWQMELTAIELGVEQPVNISFGAVGMRSKGQSNQWRFVISGTLDGNIAPADNDEISGWIKRKMTSVAKASLTNHRVCCPCKSLENHLIKVEHESEQFLPDDKHYVRFSGEHPVEFETVLNKLKADSGGD